MKKLQLKRRNKPAEVSSRITNETVAEHRERILAGGRRFKYPIQYARHRLVFNTIIISLVAIVLIIGIGWQQLYLAQNTGTFFYRVTRVLPLPVAKVDGQLVQYSNYLMNYRSSAHYLQQKEQVNLASDDGRRQLDYVKSQSMTDAIADAFAVKLAHDHNVSVSDKQVTEFIDKQRQSRDGTVSKETYDAVILDYYGWSPAEYKDAMKAKLLRQEVTYAIDTTANQIKDKLATQVTAADANFENIASAAGGQGDAKVVAGVSGLVPKDNQDGGLATAAARLKKGQVSGAIKSISGDGYYFVKLLDINANQVSYAYIKIPLTEFNKRLAAVYANHQVQKFISIPEVQNQLKK
jgi:hypothetical protein